jgi:hypothetical protein
MLRKSTIDQQHKPIGPYFLYGRKFKIVTNHAALKWLITVKNHHCARLTRWFSKLSEYDLRTACSAILLPLLRKPKTGNRKTMSTANPSLVGLSTARRAALGGACITNPFEYTGLSWDRAACCTSVEKSVQRAGQTSLFQ